MTYPGGKAGDGVYQKIINQMPPHRVYIEPFLGGGTVLLKKKPASSNIAMDSDPEVAARFEGIATVGDSTRWENLIVKSGEAISFLKKYKWRGGELVYCDPPYLMSTRSCKKDIYNHEFSTEKQHRNLLAVLKRLPCYVMISGYWSDLYAAELSTWRHISYTARTRSSRTATEFLWMNFSEPFELHDYSYLGENFRERERIKRKKDRWSERLASMPSTERYAILQAVNEAAARAGTVKNNDAAGGIVTNIDRIPPE